jgi:hypothetical protein
MISLYSKFVTLLPGGCLPYSIFSPVSGEITDEYNTITEKNMIIANPVIFWKDVFFVCFFD